MNVSNHPPITPVQHNIGWFSIFPKIVRLCVFKFAILPLSTIYQRFFLNRFHNNAAGAGFCGFSQNFDTLRAQKMVDALKALGGKEHFLTPQDREARLQVIQLKVCDIKEKIEELGGSWKKEGDRIIIEGPAQKSPAWDTHYNTVLKKIFSKEENGKLITSEYAKSIPFKENERKTECALLAKLGKSFAMSKLEIAYFLGKGIDVCVYDTRGILNSEGYPSEGGLYNDIEAVGEFLFEKEDYSPSKTCISGSCGESFTAMHLFKKYHAEGINLFLQNAPDSLGSVIKRVNVIARWLFGFSQKYVQAPKESNCSKAPEDNFDSMGKIKGLKPRQMGYVILTKTVGDDMAPESEVDNMAKKLKEKGGVVTVLENRAEDSQARPGHTDPHLADPVRNPKLQPAIHQLLF